MGVVMDTLNTTSSIVTIVGGVVSFCGFLAARYYGRPGIKAEERPIMFNHDRKDQLLIRLEFTPGARTTAYKSIQAHKCKIALTRWGEPSRETQADKTPLDSFAPKQSIDWRIPDRSNTQETLVTYVCVKSSAKWVKEPKRRMARVVVSRGLFGGLKLKVSPALEPK